MEVTPQLLNEQEFREARRGYDMRDVDEFLERVAVGVARLQDRLQAAVTEHEAQRSRIAELEVEVAQARERGAESAETDETLRRTLVLAQRTADAAVAEAEEQASRTVAAAEEQAELVLREANDSAERARIEAESEARRAGEETRRRMLDELASLEAARDALSNDSRILDRYLDEARERLRTAARDLQRLVEDPTALRERPEPDLSGVELSAVLDQVGAAPDLRGDRAPAAAGDPAVEPPDPPAPASTGEDPTEERTPAPDGPWSEAGLEVGLGGGADPDHDAAGGDHDDFEDLRQAMHRSGGPPAPDDGAQG